MWPVGSEQQLQYRREGRGVGGFEGGPVYWIQGRDVLCHFNAFKQIVQETLR